jgi:hypothetical protein
LDTQISQIRSTILTSAVDQQQLIQILDVAFIRYEVSGGDYGQQVLALLQDVEKASTSPKIFKGVIEQFLTDVHVPGKIFDFSCCPPHCSSVYRRSSLYDVVRFSFYRYPCRPGRVLWPYFSRDCNSAGYRVFCIICNACPCNFVCLGCQA